MSTPLSQEKKDAILASIRLLAPRRMTEADVAGNVGMTEAELQPLLDEYPELRREFEVCSLRALTTLKDALWHKAVSEKNVDVLKFLATAHLGIGAKDGQEKEDRLSGLSDDVLKGIHALVYPPKS